MRNVQIIFFSDWGIYMFLLRCPNPLDPALQQSVVLQPRPPSPEGHTRRFTIRTFQFLQGDELRNLEEEVRTL